MNNHVWCSDNRLRSAARRDAKPETEPRGEPIDNGDATPQLRSDETRPEVTSDEPAAAKVRI